MNIEMKNAEGDVTKEAPSMDLYVVAEQVHKNHRVDKLNDMKRQAAIASGEIQEEVQEPKLNVDGHINAINGSEVSLLEGESKTTITQEQAEAVAKALTEYASSVTELKEVKELPSNNGQEDHEPEEGEDKVVNVAVNPESGERIVTEEVDYTGDSETFEEMLERVQNSDIKLDDSPFTEEELDQYLKSNDSESIFKEIAKGTDLDPDSIKKILEVTNRKLKGEEFNVYKELPEPVQKMIDFYCKTGSVPLNTPNGNQFRNMVCDELINEFISNIGLSRIQTDFSKELETIFAKGNKEISESIVGYTAERSAAYREAAEKMEDEEKKAKLIAILDSVDEGYNLTQLKEFAKTCKLKKYDLERPDKIYRGFLRKYTDSKFNIYGIDMACSILMRTINKNADGTPIEPSNENYFDNTDINAFFLAFCKQTLNYDPNSNPVHHAYMYYTLYNCVFTEINTGDAKDVSDKFLENVREVIRNLRERNNNFDR